MEDVGTAWLKGRPGGTLAAPPAVLQRFRPAYAGALAKAVNDSLEHLKPWMLWAQAPVTDDAEESLLREAESRFDAGTEFGYLILSSSGEVVGASGLHPRRGTGALEIGYWVHMSHTRRGYATAAARRLLEEAFSLPEVDGVEIRCDETNLASAAVPRRLGFGLAGIEDRTPRTPAETEREMLWALTRQRFSQATSSVH